MQKQKTFKKNKVLLLVQTLFFFIVFLGNFGFAHAFNSFADYTLEAPFNFTGWASTSYHYGYVHQNSLATSSCSNFDFWINGNGTSTQISYVDVIGVTGYQGNGWCGFSTGNDYNILDSDRVWYINGVSTSTIDIIVFSNTHPLNGTEIPTPSTSSSISLLTPVPQTFIYNNVSVTGVYTNAHTYDTILWNVQNTTGGMSINIASSSIAMQNGTFNINKVLNLPYTGNYTVQAILFDSVSGSSTNSNTLSFGISTTSSATKVSIDATSPLDWLNLPKQLEQRIPFSYFFDIRDNWDDLASTTASTFLFQVPFGQMGTMTLSTTTFNTILPVGSTAYNLLRGFMIASMWIGVIIFLIKDIKNII